jgi:hypothetical protein
MAIVVGLLGTLCRTALLARGQLRADTYALQAQWCADAGWARAARRLNDDVAYTGERWEIALDSAGRQRVARIEIEVDRKTSDEETQVTVVAEYPFGDPRSVRRTLSLKVSVNPSP